MNEHPVGTPRAWWGCGPGHPGGCNHVTQAGQQAEGGLPKPAALGSCNATDVDGSRNTTDGSRNTTDGSRNTTEQRPPTSKLHAGAQPANAGGSPGSLCAPAGPEDILCAHPWLGGAIADPQLWLSAASRNAGAEAQSASTRAFSWEFARPQDGFG